jgi:dTDP-4-dehydrorhamnose reductase
VDALDFQTVEEAFDKAKPSVAVNCVGIVKQHTLAKDPVACLTVNALFPHRLAELCGRFGARLIHISTDCVFDGKRGGYSESDPSNAEDLYGKTKALGEVQSDGALTLRTSIIGRELESASGLVEWFLSHNGGAVKGYTRARFSGLTTLALSQVIKTVILERPSLSGLYQVAADAIDKCTLLRMVRDAFGAQIEIRPDDSVAIDRTLDGRRFLHDSGIAPPHWPAMAAALAADPTPYTNWRNA